MLDYFSAQAELRSSAPHTDVSTAASLQDQVTSSPLTEKGAGDGSYQTFHIYPLCVNAASMYNHNTLHQMLENFQENLLSCDKLISDDTLINCSLSFVNTSSQPRKLGCLTEADLNLISCNIKLDHNMPLHSVTTYSSSMQCDFNDNTGGCIKEMNDSNYFVHESTNNCTICNVDSDFCRGLTSTGTGFNPSSIGYVTNFSSSTIVSCTYEESLKGSTLSIPEFHNTRSLVSVGGDSSLVDLDCYLGNTIASVYGSLFDLGNSKEIYPHLIDKSLSVNYWNFCSNYLKSNSLDISYSRMIMGSHDYTSDLSTSQSHDIMHGSSIHTQSSEASRCTVYDTNVKFMELNNSEIPSSFRYVLKTCDGNRFTLLTNLPHFYPVSELAGSNNNWILQSFYTLRYISSLSVAQEILNNLNGSIILHVAPVYSGQIICSSEHCLHDYEMGNISDSLSSVLSENYSNLGRTVLKQNCQAINFVREAISLTEWSSVLDETLPCACIENYSECQFSRHNVRNMPNIAESKNNVLRDDLTSQITIPRILLRRIAHLASTSLIQLYPFCNCLLIHWLFSELLEGPILNLSFRYLYRPYCLLCFVSKFKCWFVAVSDNYSLRNRLLCGMCLERPHSQC